MKNLFLKSFLSNAMCTATPRPRVEQPRQQPPCGVEEGGREAKCARTDDGGGDDDNKEN